MMKVPPRRVLRSVPLFTCFVAGVALVGCSNPGSGDSNEGTGGTSTAGEGGTIGTGAGGSIASEKGGSTGTAGTTGKGGVTGTAGASHGGTTGAAGAEQGQGGAPGMGGSGPAGAPGKGGTTGVAGTFGRGGTTGAAGVSGGKGGSTGTGMGGTTGVAGTTGTGGAVTINCDAPALTGGTTHTSSNASGTAAGLSWTIWSNGSAGSITTYDVPAFSADWNNSGDFLARLGLQWNASKTYDQLGTITSQFAYKKSGSGGGYSYIGIYGWSVNPCVEFYIVDDSYNKMPVNPGSTTNKGTVTIDGGDYILYTRPTNGTGGSKCGNVSSWTQFYSVRKTARTCGEISISEHFKAWAAAGMTLGKMDQAQILVEVGGGSGSVDFTTANVTATTP
jgi:endo-1,4-beta-xylanase